MHHEATAHHGGATAARVPAAHDHGATRAAGEAAATPVDQDACRLVCSTPDESLGLLLGLPGLTPVARAMLMPDHITALATPIVPAPPNQIPPVSIPPPRS